MMLRGQLKSGNTGGGGSLVNPRRTSAKTIPLDKKEGPEVEIPP